MTFQKRIKALLFILVSVSLLTSCSITKELNIKSETKKEIETMMELIQNEDTDELIKHFSPDVTDIHNDFLVKEIEQLYFYLDGKILSYDEPTDTGYSQEAVDYGHIKLYRSNPDVENVETQDGRLLTFSFSYTVIDEKNSEHVGINQILIFTQNDNGSLDELQLDIDGLSDDE